jgi:phytoene dehydrogenase-like protein
MRSASLTSDVIVIGAGVNGLICATLLAQARRRVTVVEAEAHAGGACKTIELVAGHRVSGLAHLIGPLDAQVMKSLRLHRFGLSLSAKQISTVALSPDGRHITLGGDLRQTAQALGAHSQADAKAPHYDGVAQGCTAGRAVGAGRAGRFGRAGEGGLFGGRAGLKNGMLDAEVASFLDASIAEVLDAEFETPLLKGALAFDAVLGSALPPRARGTALLAAMRRVIHAETTEGFVHPQGGAGAFTSALLKAAEGAGVRIRLNARVRHLLFDNGRVAGVELQTGEAMHATTVVSSLDPKTTLLQFGASRHLPLAMKRRLSGFRAEGCTAKVNLALAGLPSFKGIDKRLLKERLILCTSIDQMERSFAAYEQGSFSPDPVMEITIPSTHDTTLSAGQHVLSAHVFYVPKNLASGSWDKAKANLMSCVGAVLRQYAPELPDMILAADVFVPRDIEAMAGTVGGHWHGGDLSLDQLGLLRPAVGLSRYETPVPGLFLCGAGTHPMGGITGINARNAASAVLGAEVRV